MASDNDSRALRGIEAVGPGLHTDVLEALKDQLLIVFLKRIRSLGGSLTFPVAEVDDTGSDVVSFSVHPVTKLFTFELGRKQ